MSLDEEREERRRSILAEYARLGMQPISGGDGTDDESGDDGDSTDDDGDDDDDADDAAKTGASTAKPKGSGDHEAAFKTRMRREAKKIEERVRGEITAQMEEEKARKDGDLQKQLDLIKPQAERAKELEAIVLRYEEEAEARFQAALADLPEHIRLLAPDDEDVTALEKSEWLTKKAIPAAKKYKAALNDDDDGDATDKKKTVKRGLNPFDPPPDNGKTKGKSVDVIMDRFRKSGQYRPL